MTLYIEVFKLLQAALIGGAPFATDVRLRTVNGVCRLIVSACLRALYF